MSDLREYYELAKGLVDTYSERNTLFANIDKMFGLEWDFPEGMPDWVMKVVSTDPRNSVTTVVRTFATIKPRFKITPMMNNSENRNRANQIETALDWNFKKAGRRKPTSVSWDAMWSAAMYAEVAAQVVYLPYQEKILEAMGKDTRRIKAAKRFGDYSFIFHYPGNIFVEESEYGLEGVLACRIQSVDEFRYTWGKLANKIVSEKDYLDGKVSYVTSWDYTNYEKRVVWGVCGDNNTLRTEGVGVMVLEEENKLGFIPYAIKRWGDTLTGVSDKQVMPLLQSVYESGQWDMLNVFKSMDASLAFKRASQPQYAGEYPPGQDPEIDNTEPVGILKNPPGTRNFTPLPSQSVDQRVMMQKNEFESGIWEATVARMLNTLEFPGGTPSSSVNQQLTTATNSLSPYKMLGEMLLSELAHLMLCWGKYYDKEYGKGETSLYGQYEDKTRTGEEVTIPWNTIDPDALDIETTLTADVPVDRLQQINGAVLVKNNFRVPEEELIEGLGYGNPNELAKRRDLEDYKAAYIQADMKRIALQPDLEAQQQQMEMQAGIAQQQNEQAMAQEQAARAQEEAAANAQNNATPAQEQMQGLGMNPAAGGMAPVNMANGQR